MTILEKLEMNQSEILSKTAQVNNIGFEPIVFLLNSLYLLRDHSEAKK